MKGKLTRIIAICALALAVVIPTLSSATPATAATNVTYGSMCVATPGGWGYFEWYETLKTNGYTAWVDSVTTYASHASNSSCSGTKTPWPEVSISTAIRVDRWFYPSGWSTCGFHVFSGGYGVTSSLASTGSSGGCAANPWPDGYTQGVASLTFYVNGVGYTSPLTYVTA